MPTVHPRIRGAPGRGAHTELPESVQKRGTREYNESHTELPESVQKRATREYNERRPDHDDPAFFATRARGGT